jgi:hypothetical protein
MSGTITHILSSLLPEIPNRDFGVCCTYTYANTNTDTDTVLLHIYCTAL